MENNGSLATKPLDLLRIWGLWGSFSVWLPTRYQWWVGKELSEILYEKKNLKITQIKWALFCPCKSINFNQLGIWLNSRLRSAQRSSFGARFEASRRLKSSGCSTTTRSWQTKRWEMTSPCSTTTKKPSSGWVRLAATFRAAIPAKPSMKLGLRPQPACLASKKPQNQQLQLPHFLRSQSLPFMCLSRTRQDRETEFRRNHIQ